MILSVPVRDSEIHAVLPQQRLQGRGLRDVKINATRPARVVGLFVRPRYTNSIVATSPLDPCACEINAQREHAKGDAPAVAAPCLPRGLLESGSRLEAQGSGLPDRDVVGAKRNMLSVRPKRSSCRNNRRSGLCDSDDCCDTIRCVFRSQKSVPACMRYGRAGGSWTGRSWG